MAFRVPSFPLTALVWRTPGGQPADYTLPSLVTPCNLSPGRRTLDPLSLPGGGLPFFAMELLLPKRTDIRGSWNAATADIVEVPAGTKRFYFVGSVDDVGRGFLNEYRLAVMYYQPTGVTFTVQGAIPAPVPLP